MDARGTSAKCSACRFKTYLNGHRTLFYPKPKVSIDRDMNTAINIMAKGARRFGADGGASKTMVEESSQKVILKVDASKFKHQVPKFEQKPSHYC
ncbi:MAG: transposase [Thaumarchaeota archaeon]|nr:transposase [Nitrososphaerota archaeon]